MTLGSTSHGLGKTIAHNFQQALHSASGVQSREKANTARVGLEAVAHETRASEVEREVAQLALAQDLEVERCLTQRGPTGAPQASRYLMLNQALGYIAAGGCANGPLAVVLADLGNRQMDRIRAQSFHSASTSDLRDSNLAGVGMLKQIAQHVEDPEIRDLAGQALDPLGDRYESSRRAACIERDSEVFYADAIVLHETFDQIKVLAAQGEAHNPKLLAMLQGELPEGALGSSSVGRPGGGSAVYPSPESGFGFTRPAPSDSRGVSESLRALAEQAEAGNLEAMQQFFAAASTVDGAVAENYAGLLANLAAQDPKRFVAGLDGVSRNSWRKLLELVRYASPETFAGLATSVDGAIAETYHSLTRH